MTSLPLPVACVTAGFFVSSSLSQAALTLYTDRGAFMTAVNSSIFGTMDYEDINLGEDDIESATSYSEEGISISGLSNIIGPSFGSGKYDTGSGQNANGPLGGSSTVTAPSLVSFRAAGFDLFSIGPSGDHAGTTVTVATSAGGIFEIDTAGLVNGEDIFVGFVSDVPISSFSITAPAPTGPYTDDRRWANTDNIVVSEVPEPSSTLGLAGLICLTSTVLFRRRPQLRKFDVAPGSTAFKGQRGEI